MKRLVPVICAIQKKSTNIANLPMHCSRGVQAVAVTLAIARFSKKERAGNRNFRREHYSNIAIFVPVRASLDLCVEVLQSLNFEGALLCSLDTLCRSLCGSHRRDVRDVLLDGILTDI